MQLEYNQCKCCKCGQEITSQFGPRCISHNTPDYDEVPQRLSKNHDAEFAQHTSETPIRMNAPEVPNQGINRISTYNENNQPEKRNGLDEDGLSARIQPFRRCCPSCPCGSSTQRKISSYTRSRGSNQISRVSNIEADSVLISWPTNMDQEVMVIPTSQGREVAAMNCSSLVANRCKNRQQANSQASRPNDQYRNVSGGGIPRRRTQERTSNCSQFSAVDIRASTVSTGRPNQPNNRLSDPENGERYDERPSYNLANRTGARYHERPFNDLGGSTCGTLTGGMCRKARDNFNRLGSNDRYGNPGGEHEPNRRGDRHDEERAADDLGDMSRARYGDGMTCGKATGGMCRKARDNLNRMGETDVGHGRSEDRPQKAPEEPFRQRGQCPCSALGDDGDDCGPCDDESEPVGDFLMPDERTYSVDSRSYIRQPEEEHIDMPWMYDHEQMQPGTEHLSTDFSITPSIYLRQQAIRPSLREGPANYPPDKQSYKRRVSIVETGMNTDPDESLKSENKCLSFMKKLFGKSNKKKRKKHHRHH